MVVFRLNLPTGPEVGGLLVAPKHIIVDLLLVKCMPTSALWLTLTACLGSSRSSVSVELSTFTYIFEVGEICALGKPSIKKTIFLLTFVNKQGGGLEHASHN